MHTGLVLFCHGGRDARWRALARLDAAARTVELAFLEFMSPDLEKACVALVERNAERIVVVPLFLGTGGHLRKDFPPLIESARQVAGVPVSVVAAAGDDDGVLTAIGNYCLQAVS